MKSIGTSAATILFVVSTNICAVKFDDPKTKPHNVVKKGPSGSLNQHRKNTGYVRDEGEEVSLQNFEESSSLLEVTHRVPRRQTGYIEKNECRPRRSPAPSFLDRTIGKEALEHNAKLRETLTYFRISIPRKVNFEDDVSKLTN